MSVALRIEVDTLAGLVEGVPAILACLAAHGARATFFFATGVDRSRGFWPRTFARGAQWMQQARDAGHECGVLSADPVRWRRLARHADASWTAAAMHAAVHGFATLLGEPPRAHAAAGWQSNRHALRLTQGLGFDYASDGIGSGPHYPVWCGELVRCPQVATTLPAIDEIPLATPSDVHASVDRLLRMTAPADDGSLRAQVCSMRAVRAADPRIAALPLLLQGWADQGQEVCALGDQLATFADLPRCNVAPALPAGDAPGMLMQGDVFLGDVELPEAA